MWVFWVHAGSIARFEQNYRDIADHVEIPGRKDPKANVFKLVHDFLGKEKHGEWLLILDNIDNALFPSKTERVGQGAHKPELDDKDLQSPLAYLPQSQNGRVLITTRSREVALELVEERDIVTIEPMAKPHALALLKKKLSVQGDSEDVSKLVVALDFMPLAIVQAAAYISQRAPRYSVGRYLEDFQKSDRKKTSLLNYEGGQLRRDWEAKNSIIITWQISFEYIRHSRPSAADLLSLMSFFDRQGIPDSLIRNRAESRSGHRSQEEHSIDKEREGTQESDEDNKDSASISSKDDEFEDDVQILRDYSFISTESDRTFEMHALVQLATRKWLEASGQLEQWKQRYIRNLSDEFPPGRYENWMRCQELFPHAKSAVTQQPKADESLREWALLLYNAAWYAEKRGNVVDAIQLSGIAMKVWEKILGQEHRETLNAMTMVVSAYILGGRWDEAEELGVQVMKTRKKVLDEDHPETISIKGSLALIYWNQGRWKEAGGLNIQLIETEKRVLGEEHPDTLTSISNLSLVYINQGLWKEAEKLNIQVIETKKRVLGEEHPDTLTGINNLASTYWNQGRWKEAEELNIQVIETRKRVLGEEHPNTLTSTSNLSLIYLKQDRLEEAEELDIQVIEAKKRVLGEEHPDTLASISNLSSIYLNQGRWKEAEELGIKLIGTKKRVLGVEHPVTLGSISNLASTYWNQGRWKEAEELEIRVIETQKKVLGEEHPDTLRSMKNLAWVWKAQDRSAEAIELMKECVSLRNRVLGTDHPDTLLSSEAVTEWETEEIQTSPSAISAENH
ncbi:MAG: hypothetical protein LQ342_003179 [Letrouitia transgressa]|nr:MAG: hypothetical protein LQ342_003179 [Letrouitia transgressa]